MTYFVVTVVHYCRPNLFIEALCAFGDDRPSTFLSVFLVSFVLFPGQQTDNHLPIRIELQTKHPNNSEAAMLKNNQRAKG